MVTTKNYARFYTLLNKMPTSNREHLKKQLVWQFTNNRTDSLREMHEREYNDLCNHMQRISERKQEDAETQEIKRARSAVLKRMQKIGVDTTDWDSVDQFCQVPAIAGKVFRKITLSELKQMIPKLEAIKSKGYHQVKKHNLN